jgi:hypothetical protein
MKYFIKNILIILLALLSSTYAPLLAQSNTFEFNLYYNYSQLKTTNNNTSIFLAQPTASTNKWTIDSLYIYSSSNTFQYHNKNGQVQFAAYGRVMFNNPTNLHPYFSSIAGAGTSVTGPNDLCIVNANMQTMKFNLNGTITDRICFIPNRAAGGIVPYNKIDQGLTSNNIPSFILSKPQSADSLAYIIAVDDNSHLVMACFNTIANNGNGAMRVLPHNPDAHRILPSISYTPHRNGRDYWVFAQSLTQDTCFAYLIDSNGIHPPIISTPQGYASSPFNTNGVPKRQHIINIFMANGKYLINYFDSTFLTNTLTGSPYMRHILSIYPFNNTTGIFANAIVDTFPGIYFEALSDLESSSDGTKLYITTFGHLSTHTQSHILQYDLAAANLQNIPTPSTILIDSGGVQHPLSKMLLFPDGKIYLCTNAIGNPFISNSLYSASVLKKITLGSINYPNKKGLSCQLQMNVLYDTTPRNYYLMQLPNYFSDFANYNSRFLARAKDTQNIHICYGNSYSIGTHSYATTGQFADTLQSMPYGYDSIVITKLYVHHPFNSLQNIQTCNSSYQLPSGKWVVKSGLYKDTLYNLAGCDSIIQTNLFFGHSTSSTQQKHICTNEGLVFNNHVINQAGTYYDTIPNHWGCDSFITLNVSKPNPNTTITLNTATLTTNTIGCTFQWVECVNNSPVVYTIITGATAATYTPTHNGYYACLITQDSCQFTSNVIQITNLNTGIQQLDNTIIKIQPNPSNNEWNIVFNSPVLIHKYTLYNELGQVVFEKAQTGIESSLHINASNLSAGHYLLEINSASGIIHCKLVCSK